MQALQQGDELFIAERYEEALQAWSQAMAGSSSTDAKLAGRLAAAHLRLSHYAEAEAVLASLKPEQEIDAGCRTENLYRRGLAALGLSKHRAARQFLQEAQAGPLPPAASHLQKAIANALAAASAALGVEAEAPGGTSAPLAAPAPAVGPVPVPAQAVAAPEPAPSAAAPPAAAASAAQAVAGKPRLEWFQSPSHVYVTYMCKGASEPRSKVTVKRREVSVELALPGGSEYAMDLNLFAEVLPAEKVVTFMPTKVELKLTKAVGGVMWPSLEPGKAGHSGRTGGSGGGDSASGALSSSGGSSTNGVASSAGTRAGPVSAYASKKDWSRIEKDIEADAEDKPQGEAALQALFQQIYANADEDTRRAMVKSFQTSGGTVLSTNWKEVAQKDYEKERVAPDGSVAKKWTEQ